MTDPETERAGRAVVIASAAVVVTTFLPWSESGQVSRSGWEVARAARRLGVADSGTAEVLVIAFFLVPVVASAALIAHALRREGMVAAAGAAVAVTTVVVAGAVLDSPLRASWGLWLNIAAATADGGLVFRLARRVRSGT